MKFDVSTVFLYGQPDEEMYMEQPEGFNNGQVDMDFSRHPDIGTNCFGEEILIHPNYHST